MDKQYFERVVKLSKFAINDVAQNWILEHFPLVSPSVGTEQYQTEVNRLLINRF